MTDAARLLREIAANPAADVLRLAFADAIEERDGPGDEAWAVFVRVQVELANRDDERCGCRECRPNGQHNNGPCRSPIKELRRRERDLWPAVRPVFDGYGWISCLEGSAFSKREAVSPSNAILIVRRGFPAVVRCTLAEWMVGEECQRCRDDGKIWAAWSVKHESAIYPGRKRVDCPTCRDTGRTTGIGPRLAQRWPVESVEVVDNEVWKTLEGLWTAGGGNGGPALPSEIWEIFADQELGWPYRSDHAARDALSAASIQWARSQVI